MNWRDIVVLAALLGLYLTASATEPRTTESAAGSTNQYDVRQGREGTIWYADASYPDDYLAIPIGPGIRVQVCGPARCLSLVSTDAGPNRAMLLRGRIADVSIPLFRRLCSCSESRGYFEGSWHVGPRMTLPPTSTE